MVSIWHPYTEIFLWDTIPLFYMLSSQSLKGDGSIYWAFLLNNSLAGCCDLHTCHLGWKERHKAKVTWGYILKHISTIWSEAWHQTSTLTVRVSWLKNGRCGRQLYHKKVIGDTDFNKEIIPVSNTDCKYVCYLHKPIWISVEINTNHNVTFTFFLDRLFIQLDETGRAFSQFWSEHLLQLNQYLQLQHFEHNFCEVLFSHLLELPFMVHWLLVFSSPLNSGAWASLFSLIQSPLYSCASS